ncbi:MAG: protein phosphatase 2C domain-containing protein [Opitutaceae bacterium]|jgi:protein phosphatase|nr:protein phosphatase 2C domain-containing protein [Opitutaceae bacterium]
MSDSIPAAGLHWSGLTHRGKVRPNNEDTFLALNFDGHEVRYLGKTGEATLRGGDFVFAVSDGMGGARSGEFASRIAVDKITKLLPRAYRLSAAGMNAGFTDVVQELFIAIHDELLKLGRSYAECSGMGATLTLAWFTPEWLYFGHIGDSRLYYLPREGGMRQLSHDHSYVGWLRREGKINEREAREHPGKNSLQQALGAGHQFVDPQVGALAHRPGDRILLCSDGVIDGLWDRALEDLIRDPGPARLHQPAAFRIVEEALENSGRDNLTALVVEIAAGSTSA